jgi:hypothetical protein
MFLMLLREIMVTERGDRSLHLTLLVVRCVGILMKKAYLWEHPETCTVHYKYARRGPQHSNKIIHAILAYSKMAA